MAGVVSLLLAGAANAAPFGAISQLSGLAGCIEHSGGTDGCATSDTLAETSGVVVSPDGKNAYAAAQNSNAVLVFSRDPSTGALALLPAPNGCITSDASAPACATGRSGPGRALAGAHQVIVSPDGKNVYVTASHDNAVAEFTRDQSTGALTQPSGTAGCIADGSGSTATGCATGRRFSDVRGLAISPDGKTVYVAALEGAVGVLSRDSAGALSQSSATDGCVSPTSVADCAPGRALREPSSVLVSPDGKNVYVAASEGLDSSSNAGPTGNYGAVDSFARDSNSGAITQLAGAAGCINQPGNDGSGAGTCSTGKALYDADGSAISPDGKNVYVAAQGASISSGKPGSLALFSRDPSSGALNQLPGTAGCVSLDGTDGNGGPAATCATGRGLFEPSGVAVSPDGRTVYSASSDGLYASTNKPGGSIGVFARAATDGALTQLSGPDGCHVSGGLDATCTQDRALEGANHLAVSPDCSSLYGASQDAYNGDFSNSSNLEGAITAFSRPTCSAPASAAAVAACTATGTVSLTVTDSVGTTGAKRLHYRLDAGPEQVIATSGGNPGSAQITVPNGTHSLEYWGEDEYANLERAHHTATFTVDTVKHCIATAQRKPAPRINVFGYTGARGACVSTSVRPRFAVSDVAGVTRVEVFVDGRRVLRTTHATQRLTINVKRLSTGRHALTIRVRDRTGRRLSRTVHFDRCAMHLPRFTG